MANTTATLNKIPIAKVMAGPLMATGNTPVTLSLERQNGKWVLMGRGEGIEEIIETGDYHDDPERAGYMASMDVDKLFPWIHWQTEWLFDAAARNALRASDDDEPCCADGLHGPGCPNHVTAEQMAAYEAQVEREEFAAGDAAAGRGL